MSNYQGAGTLVVGDTEIEVVVTLSGSRSEPAEWGGSAQVTAGLPEEMESEAVTLRLPDGRESRVLAKGTAIGSGRLKISGIGPVPF